jgi:hypothetical protein
MAIMTEHERMNYWWRRAKAAEELAAKQRVLIAELERALDHPSKESS